MAFDLKTYKMNYFFDNANLSIAQRKDIELTLDDETDLEEFNKLQNIQKNISSFVNSGDNLYIYSQSCGNGKTSWSVKILKSYIETVWKKYATDKCPALLINVPRYLLSIKDNISEKNDYVAHIKNNVLQADLVVWDEVGTKGLTSFEHENVISIIDARLNMNKSNIYTSNLSKDELHRSVGDRLFSRIYNNSELIQLNGVDKRGMRA